MRHFPFALLALFALLAGCAAEGASDLAPAAASSPVIPYTQTAEGHIGWLAAAGIGFWGGDTEVGLYAEDVCPQVLFVVPPGASTLRVHVDEGPTLANIAITAIDQAWFFGADPLDGPLDFEEASPAAGLWSLAMYPGYVIANDVRAYRIEVDGEAATPLDGDVVLREAHDCLR